MSKRGDRLYLGHMYDLARRVHAKVFALTRADFDRDENLQLAVTHLLQNIGEAARHLSEETRNAHPEVPWQKIVGMRHKVVHDYFEIDLDIVWQAATSDIPELLTELEKFVPPNP